MFQDSLKWLDFQNKMPQTKLVQFSYSATIIGYLP